MPADVVLVGGRVVTMTRPGVSASAVALSAGRLQAIGTESDVLPLVGASTLVYDVAGATVLPGLIDCHVHLVQTGRGLIDPSLRQCRSVDAVLHALRESVEQYDGPADSALMFQGCQLDRLDRPLTAADLDAVVGRRPVFVGDAELHSAVVNRAGRLLAGLGDGNERVRGEAHTDARRRFHEELGDAHRVAAVRAAASLAISRGLTTIHAIEGRDAFGWRDLEVLRDERDAGRLPLHLVLYSQASNLSRAHETGVSGAADLWADGAYSDRSAALLEPYADAPETYGQLYYADADLLSVVSEVHQHGQQVAMHAIGDAAIGQVLAAYAAAQDAFPRPDPRHRIEHFSLPTAEQIEQAAALELTASVQPALLPDSWSGGLGRVGAERGRRRHAYRDMLRAGVRVCGGSDSDFGPLDPLLGIQSTVNHPNPDQALSLQEALELFTVNAARAAFLEHEVGSLEISKRANLVVLDGDLFSCPTDHIANIGIRAVLADGRVVSGSLGEPCRPS